MLSVRVQRFRQMHDEKPVELYLGALSAEELIDRTRVAFYDPATNVGYQRVPSEPRQKEISRYILKKQGLLPTAVLVNIRSGAEFKPETHGSNFGTLNIPDGGKPFWLIDGQHRVGGLERAIGEIRRSHAIASVDYDVPVAFIIDFDESEEMELFHVVNTKAKNVPTDLAGELLSERVRAALTESNGGKKVSATELRKYVGIRIAHYLHDTPGPWQDRIRLPNESKDDVKKKSMQINTIAATLTPVLRDRFIETNFVHNPNDPDFEQLSKIVLTYWKALEELMPEAFANPGDYSVQKPVGVYTFHELLPEVVDDCRRDGNYSQAFMRDQLRHLEEWVTSRTWHLEHGEDLIKANNRRTINVIIGKMKSLYGVETPQLGE